MKYSLSRRVILRASRGLWLFFTVYPDLSYNTISISKSCTYSIVLPGTAILEELILCIGLAAGAIFSRIAQ